MIEGDIPPISSGTLPYARRLEEYLEVAARLFPGVPRGELDPAPLPQADAVESALFLERMPREAALLQAGTLSGLCAFHFAGVQGVRRVLCSGPDQKVGKDGPGALEVAQAVLAEAGEGEKVRFQEGYSAELPAAEFPVADDALSVVLLTGPHTREGVRAELESLSARDPYTLFLVPGCRGEGGPFVQAGIVDFMEESVREHRFRLFGDLTPGLASSGIGLLFPGDAAETAEKALSDLASMFSGRLDPLRLLNREEELVERANRFRDELVEKADLEEHNRILRGQLQGIQSSRSWRFLERVDQLKKRITGTES